MSPDPIWLTSCMFFLWQGAEGCAAEKRKINLLPVVPHSISSPHCEPPAPPQGGSWEGAGFVHGQEDKVAFSHRSNYSQLSGSIFWKWDKLEISQSLGLYNEFMTTPCKCGPCNMSGTNKCLSQCMKLVINLCKTSLQEQENIKGGHGSVYVKPKVKVRSRRWSISGLNHAGWLWFWGCIWQQSQQRNSIFCLLLKSFPSWYGDDKESKS